MSFATRSAKALNAVFLYGLIGALGTVMAFYPVILSGFARIPTTPSDPSLNNYILEHSFQVVFNRDYIGSLWSPAMFYPFPGTLAFSENLFGTAPLYWGLRGVASPDLAFQIWMIAVTLLGYGTFVWVLRQYQVSPVLAALGGFLFAFGMPRVAQVGHPQLLPQFFTPIAFFFAWQFLCKPSTTRLACVLLLTYLQILAGIYLGWYLLFSLLLMLPIALYLNPEMRQELIRYLRRRWQGAITLLALWFALNLALLKPYFAVGKLVGERTFTEVETMLPRLVSWLLAPEGSPWRSLIAAPADLPMQQEHQLFLGFTVLGLTAFSIYVLKFKPTMLTPSRSRLVQVCLGVSLVIFLLSLQVAGFTLWHLVYDFFPGAKAIRALSRICLIVYFYLLIAVLLCLDGALKTRTAQGRIAIATLICTVAMAEQLVLHQPSYEKAPVLQAEIEMQALMADCDVAYATIPTTGNWIQHQMSAIWAGLKAGVPVINGYSGALPPTYPNFTRNMKFSEFFPWLGNHYRGRLCVISSDRVQLDNRFYLDGVASIQGGEIATAGAYRAFKFQLPPNSPLTDFAQSIQASEIARPLKVGETVQLPVILKNTSRFTWFQGGSPINLSYRWLRPNGQTVVDNGNRTPLDHNIPPGEAIALTATVTAPDQPGTYLLRLSLVQEGVAWFVDRGARSEDVPVTVIK